MDAALDGRLCDDAALQSKDPKDRTWTCFFMSKTKIINALKCEIMIPLRSITKRREPWFFLVATLNANACIWDLTSNMYEISW